MKHTLLSLLFILTLFFLNGCHKTPSQDAVSKLHDQELISQEGIDPSCAYFYFMWGSHAELSGKYAESLQAYQKALLCDPTSEIIKNKIPVLLIKSGQKTEAISYLKKQLQENPSSINERLILATLYLQDEEDTKAISLYEEVLKLEPDREDVLLRMGSIYSQHGENDKAEKLLKHLISNNTELYFAHLYLARIYLNTDRPAEAEEYYLKAMELNWSVDLVHEIGSFYKMQRDYKAYVALYEEHTSSAPYDEFSLYALVEGYLQLKMNQQAVDTLVSMRSFAKTPYTIDLIISKIDISENKKEAAVERLDNLLTSPAASEARFLLALIYAQKDPEKALEYLEDVENDFFDFENAIYLQAKLFKTTNQIDQAIASIQARLNSPKDRRPSFYNILSALFQIKEQPEKAIEAMETAVEQFPEDGNIYFEYSLLLEQEKHHAKALEAMEKVIQLQPENPEALNFVGYTWADKNIKLEQALTYLEKAQQLKPESGYIRDSLGWVHYRMGNLELARDHLEAAVQMEDGDPHIYDHLGDVYRDLEQHLKARKAYAKALEAMNDEPERTTIKQKIEQLNPTP